jgi:hypothetical protein
MRISFMVAIIIALEKSWAEWRVMVNLCDWKQFALWLCMWKFQKRMKSLNSLFFELDSSENVLQPMSFYATPFNQHPFRISEFVTCEIDCGHGSSGRVLTKQGEGPELNPQPSFHTHM